MTVLMTRIVERSNGPLVLSQLQEVQAQIGRIAQVLADQGSDIASGARLFCELVSEGTTIYAEDAALAKTPELLISNDYSHASSHILKENLEADPKWQEFLGHCVDFPSLVDSESPYVMIGMTRRTGYGTSKIHSRV